MAAFFFTKLPIAVTYANRKSLRTGDPENSGFNRMQLDDGKIVSN